MEKRTAFSLIEVLAAMVIGSMVLVAVLTLYGRIEKTASAVTKTLDETKYPYEVLQLIAEDLDKMITTNSDTSIIIVNRRVNDYNAPIFAIRVEYKDPSNKDQLLEEIIWQCNKNPEGDANDLVLYRSYEGIVPEDKLLDKNKEDFEKDIYVPICNGITFFEIQVHTGKEEPELAWTGGMPLGITMIISFAKPFKTPEGYYDVQENQKYSRTVALDKSRKIKFDISGTNAKKDNQIPMGMNK